MAPYKDNVNKTTVETNARIKEIEGLLQRVLQEQDVKEGSSLSFPEYVTDFPLPPGECFVGRKRIIDKVVEELIHKESCYLYSMGGIGKTEIAKKVINKLENILSVDSGIERIAWINYQDRNLKLSICKGLFETRNIDDINQAWGKSLSLFRQYKDKMLIVIDNIEESVEDEFLKLVEHTKCRFLITSRWDGFHVLKKIPVEELSLEESLSLFNYYYTGRKNNLIASEIIQLVECHTVMVELLAKIAATEEWTLNEFKQRLVCAGFKVSEEEVSSSHSELKKERKVIEQLKILYKVIGCNREEEQLLVKISVMPFMPFPFSKAKNWLRDSYR